MKKRLDRSKKSLVIVGGITIVLCGIFTLDMYHAKEYKDIEKSKEMAFFIKSEEGDYTKVNNIPATGYSLNSSKSVCSNGAIPSWSNGTLTLNNLRKKNTSCYLYFDKTPGLTSSDIVNTLNTTTQTDSVPNFANAATTNEGVFKTSDGMYGGDTYYWRGAVDNNHVIFADMCWKIIRINGDGSIRIIYNGVPENGVCKQVSDSTSIAVSSQKYNSSYNYSYYVGWTYGTGQRPADNDSATASNIKVQTDTWYEDNISKKGYDRMVATGKFCNDRNTAYKWTQSGSTFYYAVRDRIGVTKEPITTCPEGDIYEMKAGAITADEVSMAGGVYSTANSSYFLYNGQDYWTISPYHWKSSSGYVSMFSIYTDGQPNYAGVDATYGVRPVINLLSSTIFKQGTNGTSSSPYEVI